MRSLFCLGFGYCAARFVTLHGAGFDHIAGTSRSGAPAAAHGAGIAHHRLDGAASRELLAVAESAETILVSAPPDLRGDPMLAVLAPTLAASRRRGPIVYLSTIGVYGDSGGRWIDETAPLASGLDRAQRRIAAEAAWIALGRSAGRPVAVLRLGGIYGPGRNALADLAAGRARRIDRPGQMFNRVHVDDIAAAIRAAMEQDFDGVVNVVDDHPAPAADPVTFAARLLGAEPPPLVPFERAAPLMSAMARSFWADNRRVRNDRLRHNLGVGLTYPSYREGLAALHAAGEGRPRPS